MISKTTKEENMCKSETDIEAIKSARAVMQYCEKHENCKDCAFDDGMDCMFNDAFRFPPKDWKLPEIAQICGVKEASKEREV